MRSWSKLIAAVDDAGESVTERKVVGQRSWLSKKLSPEIVILLAVYLLDTGVEKVQTDLGKQQGAALGLARSAN